MEATSVRMADSARMGQGGVGWQPPSLTPLQRYIRNACDPQNYEPNLALNMEIVDLINSKGASAYVITLVTRKVLSDTSVLQTSRRCDFNCQPYQ